MAALSLLAWSLAFGQGVIVGPDGEFSPKKLSLPYALYNEVYANGSPAFPDERAGSNDSDKDNFIDGDGWDEQPDGSVDNRPPSYTGSTLDQRHRGPDRYRRIRRGR